MIMSRSHGQPEKAAIIRGMRIPAVPGRYPLFSLSVADEADVCPVYFFFPDFRCPSTPNPARPIRIMANDGTGFVLSPVFGMI